MEEIKVLVASYWGCKTMETLLWKTQLLHGNDCDNDVSIADGDRAIIVVAVDDPLAIVKYTNILLLTFLFPHKKYDDAT
jgi:hypothetical protein